MSIQVELRRIVEAREVLSFEEAAALMRQVLAGEAADVELAALLGALAGRGETAAEIAGFATAMREAATTLPLTAAEQAVLVDTCGTGGDASGSFNISTAAALVAAAGGAKVAKHGNKAITSRCGSADVLDALGIPTTLTPADAAAALREFGFCFMLAPSHHPAMKAVMPVRRAMGVRTVLHALGPLLNPAGARAQVMGVYSARLVPVVAEAMTMLGVRHAFVVHGDGGLDELALSGTESGGRSAQWICARIYCCAGRVWDDAGSAVGVGGWRCGGECGDPARDLRGRTGRAERSGVAECSGCAGGCGVGGDDH